MENEKSTEFKTTTSDAEIRRLTAYKVWLSDINEREFQQKEGVPDYVDVVGNRVSRVNIIASVVDKFDSENYSSLTLDDGSAQIRLKAFGDSIQKLNGIEAGDIITTISRLRNFNNENYLLPEVIKKVTSKQALLRRLELIIDHGKREPGEKSTEQAKLPQTEKEKTDVAKDDLKDRLKIYIEKIDEGEGVEISLLRGKFEEKDNETFQKIIEDLLSEGEAYEPRPGKIKLI